MSPDLQKDVTTASSSPKTTNIICMDFSANAFELVVQEFQSDGRPSCDVEKLVALSEVLWGHHRVTVLLKDKPVKDKKASVTRLSETRHSLEGID